MTKNAYSKGKTGNGGVGMQTGTKPTIKSAPKLKGAKPQGGGKSNQTGTPRAGK
jgi:hypothetical protein